MRKVIFLAMMCVVPALFAQNILDKQMGTFDADPAWEEYSGQNAAATLTKAADFVNFTKTATGHRNRHRRVSRCVGRRGALRQIHTRALPFLAVGLGARKLPRRQMRPIERVHYR